MTILEQLVSELCKQMGDIESSFEAGIAVTRETAEFCREVADRMERTDARLVTFEQWVEAERSLREKRVELGVSPVGPGSEALRYAAVAARRLPTIPDVGGGDEIE